MTAKNEAYCADQEDDPCEEKGPSMDADEVAGLPDEKSAW